MASPVRSNWVDVVPHIPGTMITGMYVHPDHLVRQERHEGLPRIVVRPLDAGVDDTIAFPEEAYGLSLEGRREFAANTLRFTYASMTTPRETYDFDLATRERTLRKRKAVPERTRALAPRDPSLPRDGRRRRARAGHRAAPRPAPARRHRAAAALRIRRLPPRAFHIIGPSFDELGANTI